MRPPRPPAPTDVSATLRIELQGRKIEARLTVPAGPVKPQAALPAIQSLVNAVVDSAERATAAAGKPVSCRKGCGACCRQLVPVSDVEAHALRALVDAMPAERKARVEARFSAAAETLQAAGLKEFLLNPRRLPTDDSQGLGFRYFEQRLDCPFLEDEACSIHPDRPLVCREYLVTSPAANCSAIEAAELAPVEIPKLSALARTMTDPGGDVAARWTALALALPWVAANPDSAALKPGPAWINAFLDRLNRNATGQPVAGSAATG